MKINHNDDDVRSIFLSLAFNFLQVLLDELQEKSLPEFT